MKQKLFLLMVLVAGLVACTKDEDTQDIEIEELSIENEYGEFEGNWILNNVTIETDTLTVMDDHFFVRTPSVPLIKYAVNELFKKSLFFPDNKYKEYDGNAEQSEYTTGPFIYYYVNVEATYGSHIWPYDYQGYSLNNAYFNVDGLKSDVTQNYYIIANGIANYYGDNKSYNLSICTNQPMVAVFNKDTHLWTLKMTLTKINYHISGVDEENTMVLQSPAELLFVATKKIGNTETD
jgi:hypothetical protein